MHVGTLQGLTVDSVRDARVALRSARYDAALELLEGCEEWPAPDAERGVLLKTETLARRDPVAALHYLTGRDDVFSSVEGRFEREVETGRLFAAVRDFDSAAVRYATARTLADAVEHGAATIAYHDVRMRWYRRDCDPEAPEVALALTHPDPSIVAAVYSHRAWLHAGRGEYRAQIADLRAALGVASATGEPVDVYTRAVTLQALARIAFETADESAIHAARAWFDAIPWTPDVALYRFETLRALGWDAFMRGRSGQAQWLFKDARAVAPSTAWRAMAHLDRAYVARIARNEAWALEELGEADRLAHEVRWESTFGEERQALVVLAVLHAPVDAGRAPRYASLYSQVGVENVDPRLAIAGDRRQRAAARYAQGLIDMTLGRPDAAVAALLEAYGIYDTAGHHYRATLAAAALAEVTGEAHWRDLSVAHASRYPDCPLAAVADDAVTREEAMPRPLSPLQRQIARALFAGADASELSYRFSRSMYTVERHIAVVFDAFGVHSRGELAAVARSRGLA